MSIVADFIAGMSGAAPTTPPEADAVAVIDGEAAALAELIARKQLEDAAFALAEQQLEAA